MLKCLSLGPFSQLFSIVLMPIFVYWKIMPAREALTKMNGDSLEHNTDTVP